MAIDLNRIEGMAMKSLSKVIVLMVAGLLASPAIALEGDPQAGEQKAAACAACHGQDGNSAAAANPKLAGQGVPYTVKQLKEFKSGERENAIMKGMAAGLSEQDMYDIAAYYAQQSIEVGSANPEYVEAGRKLWLGGNAETGVAACAGCHGPAGQGMEAAEFPALGGQHAGYIESQLKAFRNAGTDALEGTKRANDPNGMMRDIASKMTDKEIRAVSSYVSGLSQ
jgi:cytochrome c553